MVSRSLPSGSTCQPILLYNNLISNLSVCVFQESNEIVSLILRGTSTEGLWLKAIHFHI